MIGPHAGHHGPNILTVLRDNGHASVTLNRPEVHNAFDEATIAAMAAAFRTLGDAADVRCIVVRGAGDSFCAGADLDWMRRAAGFSEAKNRADALALAELLRSIHDCPRPVIAAVHGPAYGGGVGLVAACDIAIASDRAAFALSEVRLGLIPATISPYVLSAIGPRAARRYMLTAERFSALEAHRLGLVHEVVPGHMLDAAVDRIADQIVSGAPGALAETKRLIADIAHRGPDAVVAAETADRIAARRASDEGREGVAAFLEKRKPAWAR